MTENHIFRILKLVRGLGLSLAVVSSLLAAYFNVQIPVSIGSITSVIATMVNRTEPLGCKEYWDQTKGPALRFIGVVAAQAAATVSTISFLSNVMEQATVINNFIFLCFFL